MKKLLLIVLLCVGGWKLYEKQNVPIITNADLTSLNVPSKVEIVSRPVPINNFTCDGREYCNQMSSCEEATFFIRNCPNTKMDGDNDGIPCESQFCSR